MKLIGLLFFQPVVNLREELLFETPPQSRSAFSEANKISGLPWD
jgi:hypothetical protein